jgi:hypothetical protein
MSAPAAVIRFELEAAPRVYADCLNESEFRRLLDWIDTHPELRAVLEYVGELQEEARAA